MIAAVLLAAGLLGGTPDEADTPRWKVQAARLPVEKWKSAVDTGPVLVASQASSEGQRALAGQVKRAVAAALAAQGVKVVTLPVATANAQAAQDAAASQGCTHVVLAAVAGSPAEPALTVSVRSAAGEVVQSQDLSNLLAEAPPLAFIPILSEEKLKRDAATLAFPSHAAHVTMMTMTRDGIPVSHELRIWDDKSARASGFGTQKRTTVMCRIANLPKKAVSKVCKKDMVAVETWSAGDAMPKRAVQLLVLADAYNNAIANILGADTLEFDEEYFPVREIQKWQEKHERDAKKKKKQKEAAEQDDEE